MADLTVSANVDTLMGAANFAAFRNSLGLTSIVLVTPGTGVATALAVNVGSAGAFAVIGGALGTPSSADLSNANNYPAAFLTGQVPLANGGTGANLTDPNADRILFWDDSAGAMTWLTLGTNLSITGTTINASGGAGGGDVTGPSSATDNAIARFDSTTGKLIQDSSVTIDDSGNVATSGSVTAGSASATTLVLGGTTVTATGTAINTWFGITRASGFDTFVATPSGANLGSLLTSALTVAKGGTGLTSGTSGGILAYTASGTLASSGALAANAIVIGGGAGVAPSTTTTGTGVLTALGVNVGSAGAFVTFNGAAGTPSSMTGTNITGLPASGIAAGVLGGAITLGEGTAQIVLDAALSADGTYSGIVMVGTAGYTQAFGDVVYLDPTDSRWEACDANSAAGADGDSRGTVGMVVVAGTDGTSCTVLIRGKIRADAKFPTFTINNPIYISETAGSVTQTQPSTASVVIRIIGAALTTDEMLFMPDCMWITHA